MSFDDFYKKALFERDQSIRRFSGVNAMSDAELLTFLHKLQYVATSGSINLDANDKISMTERIDGVPVTWGNNPEFFIEVKGSGEITADKIESFNKPETQDIYEAFKFLESYEPLQENIQKAESYAGSSVKYMAEMFPMLTHKCDDLGNIIFCSTTYNKKKFGNKGAFIISDVKIKEEDSWVNPSDDIKDMLVDIVRTTEDPEWKVMYAPRDGKLSGSLKFDFSGISTLVSDPSKLAETMAILRNANDPNHKIIKELISKIRPELQKQLDSHTQSTKPNISNEANNAILHMGDMSVATTQREEEKLVGGKADNMTLEQIAAKHGVDIELIKAEFTKGVKEELEHTTDHEVAGEIARDHLVINPRYYTDLGKSGIDDAEIDELKMPSLTDIGTTFRSMFDKPPATAPDRTRSITMGDIDDDLPEKPLYPHSTNSASNPLDDTNIPDQDPSYKQGDLRHQLVGHDETPEQLAQKKKQRRADALHDYIHGHNDIDQFASEYVEDAEEFEEDEILDERKFEKVKMARSMLSKLGYPKSYERNEKGKYILRSKHIRKLMNRLGYVFSDAKARWISKPDAEKKKQDDTPAASIDAPEGSPQEPEVETPTKNAIIWVGHAKPWGNAHDDTIQKGLESLNSVDASMVFVMLVKEETGEAPEDFNQQINDISNKYANDERVDVSSIAVPTSSIVDVFVTASKQNIIIKAWLTGSEHIPEYQEQFNAFKADKYKEEFEQKTKPGTQYPFIDDIIFISTDKDAPPHVQGEVYNESIDQLKASLSNIFFGA